MYLKLEFLEGNHRASQKSGRVPNETSPGGKRLKRAIEKKFSPLELIIVQNKF